MPSRGDRLLSWMFFFRSERVYPAMKLFERSICLESWRKASRHDQDFQPQPCDCGPKKILSNYSMTLGFTPGSLPFAWRPRLNRGVNPLATVWFVVTGFIPGSMPFAWRPRSDRGVNPLATVWFVVTGFMPGSMPFAWRPRSDRGVNPLATVFCRDGLAPEQLRWLFFHRIAVYSPRIPANSSRL